MQPQKCHVWPSFSFWYHETASAQPLVFRFRPVLTPEGLLVTSSTELGGAGAEGTVDFCGESSAISPSSEDPWKEDPSKSFSESRDGDCPAPTSPIAEEATRDGLGFSCAEQTAAEAAGVTAIEEESLPEVTSGVAEDTAIGACIWAAAPQPARFFFPFYRVESYH